MSTVKKFLNSLKFWATVLGLKPNLCKQKENYLGQIALQILSIYLPQVKGRALKVNPRYTKNHL